MQEYKPVFKIPEGQQMPDFKLTDHEGGVFRISDIKSDWIVLFFYPQDNTPTCTKEACNIRDNFAELSKHSITVMGISPDDAASHQKFIKKFDLPYKLIVDTDHTIAEELGIWSLKKFMGKVYEGIHRVTIVLKKDRTIHRYIYPVESTAHADQIMKAIES
jgi:peroxiredoxin Q/BCP